MFPAFLSAIFFSLSGVCASRSTHLIGSIKANFYRLVFAFLCLTFYAYIWGKGLQGPGLRWFLLSDAIGVGLGDTFFFLAIRRIGPRLSVMLDQGLTAPIGALVEWAWLGTTLTPFQLLGGIVVIFGSALALLPEKKIRISPRLLRTGILFGTLGALG